MSTGIAGPSARLRRRLLLRSAGASGPVPFTELVSLGATSSRMFGFFPGRVSSIAARPSPPCATAGRIGPWLDGSMQVAVGNLFGVHLEDFDPKLLRLSAALGIQSDASPDGNFQFFIGFGTETFDHGGQIDSFRLAFGTSRFLDKENVDRNRSGIPLLLLSLLVSGVAACGVAERRFALQAISLRVDTDLSSVFAAMPPGAQREGQEPCELRRSSPTSRPDLGWSRQPRLSPAPRRAVGFSKRRTKR